MRIERLPSLEAAREAWESLELSAGRIFSTWLWADVWWRHFGAGQEHAIHSVHDDGGRLAAVIPLYRTRLGPIPAVRLLGHGVGDELGLVCAPSDAALAAEALRQVCRRELPAYGVALVDRVVGDDPVGGHLRGIAMRAEATPVLWCEGRDWESWLTSLTGHHRRQIRVEERRLHRDHDVRYRLTADTAHLDGDMDTLIRLHRMRWSDGSSVAFASVREAFHREFARRALERGWLRLYTAEVDEQPVAMVYNFRFAKSEWGYQVGRDPAWSARHVGSVLLLHAIRTTFEDGLDAYRFGVGNEEYKLRLASADPGLRTIAVGGAAVRSAARLAVALPRGVGRQLGRFADRAVS